MSLNIKKLREQIILTKEGDDYVATHPSHPTLSVCAPTIFEAEQEILQYVMYMILLENIK
jgi:hypothetical protein